MHELPLLIFTLFLQGSVGVTLWLAFGSTQRSALLPAAGAFVLASLGLLASALHMGYPLNAFNALRHVSSSWLSREIIFASLYLAALGLATLLMFVKSLAGSHCWLWQVLSGWWMCSAWRRSTCTHPW